MARSGSGSFFQTERRFLADEARHRSLVLFLGAGVSLNARLPNWDSLVQPFRERLELGGTTNPIDVAQWYTVIHGRSEMIAHVRSRLGEVKQPGELHRILARIPAPVTFTTNYDQLFEKALEDEQGVPPDVIIEDSDIPLMDEARRTTVIKLHGCLSVPESIVLSRDDYDSYSLQHRAMIAYLQSLLATRTFLFVGFSLTDPNFRAIHHAITSALGAGGHNAYNLTARGRETSAERISHYLLEDWKRKGVDSLVFDSYVQVPDFLDRVATDARGGTSALKAADTLARDSAPPVVRVGPLVQQIQTLQETLSQVVHQATEEGIFSELGAGAVETPPDAVVDETGLWLRSKARALLDLVQAVDRLAPIKDDDLWASIGDILYAQGDATGAIHAYDVVLRPSEDGDCRAVDERVLLRVRGNLARAYAHQGHYNRAEWLLRRCVFKRGEETSDEQFDAANVYQRLNLDHLSDRPCDASEFTYILTKRAEELRRSGRSNAALGVLREARYVLRPVLGLPPHGETDRFAGERTRTEQAGKSFDHYQRYLDQGRSSTPETYAYNYLGKCYRMAVECALDLGRGNVLDHLTSAEEYLCQASHLDPAFPYPYGHRAMLATERRLPEPVRVQVAGKLHDDLAAVEPTQREAIVTRLRGEYPTLW